MKGGGYEASSNRTAVLERLPYRTARPSGSLQSFVEGHPAFLRDEGRGEIPSAIGMLVILHRLHISHIALALQGVQVVYYLLRGMGDTTPAIGELL
jgi:hypothetical protein